MHPAAVFPRTILRFGGAAPFEVDLRRRPGAATLRRLRALGLGRRFGIVTPFNPGGRPATAASNRRRLRRLERLLPELAPGAVTADGLSISRRHRECGYAIAAPRRRLVALAKEFGQLAIFWFDGRRFLLVWCDRPARGVPLAGG